VLRVVAERFQLVGHLTAAFHRNQRVLSAANDQHWHFSSGGNSRVDRRRWTCAGDWSQRREPSAILKPEPPRPAAPHRMTGKILSGGIYVVVLFRQRDNIHYVLLAAAFPRVAADRTAPVCRRDYVAALLGKLWPQALIAIEEVVLVAARAVKQHDQRILLRLVVSCRDVDSIRHKLAVEGRARSRANIAWKTLKRARILFERRQQISRACQLGVKIHNLACGQPVSAKPGVKKADQVLKRPAEITGLGLPHAVKHVSRG